MKSLFLIVLRSIIFIFTISVGCVSTYGQAPITLRVDLRDAPRKLLHATETIPVHPGAMTLAYPKWIGNEHELGPIGQQAGLLGQILRSRPVAVLARVVRLGKEASNLSHKVLLSRIQQFTAGFLQIFFRRGSVVDGLALIGRLVARRQLRRNLWGRRVSGLFGFGICRLVFGWTPRCCGFWRLYCHRRRGRSNTGRQCRRQCDGLSRRRCIGIRSRVHRPRLSRLGSGRHGCGSMHALVRTAGG